MSNNPKKLMVIGGTWEQVPLIQTARRSGCEILVTDPNPHAEGLALADHTKICNPRDLPALMEIANAYRPDGITADECDYSFFASAFLAFRRGLPSSGLSAALTTTNKLWMRQKAQQGRVLQPRFFGAHTLHDAREAVRLIDWPVIIKPVDNRGATGVSIASNGSSLREFFLDALMYSHSRQAIVEAYVEGTHVTVDGCIDQKGHYHQLGVATKKVTSGDKPIIYEVTYPAELSDQVYQDVLEMDRKAVDALEIKGGLTHSEYIVDDKGRCFLVETANRGGGVWTSAVIIPKHSSVDVSDLLVSNALGQPFAVNPAPTPGYVVLRFFVFPPGTVTGIYGVKDVEKLPGVLAFRINIKPGDTLEQPRSGAGRHGFAIIEGDTRELIEERVTSINQTLGLTYE